LHDQAYTPFPAFATWAAHTGDSAAWNEAVEAVAKLQTRQSVAPAAFAHAKATPERLAALETGITNVLYLPQVALKRLLLWRHWSPTTGVGS
jgi:hypothetical protein